MLKRTYGKTGIELSVVGFGGIICMNESAADSARYVAEARDRGINYFDVAPSYGNAEEMLGPALAPYRKDVFLACKTGKRDAAGAEQELNRSLELLKTDHFDLYQHHAVTTAEDVEQIFAPKGAMVTFEKALKEGKVRHLGFSAHSEEAALAMLEHYAFASVLFPVNWVTWNTGHFGPQVIKAASEGKFALLALKALAKRKWNEGEEHRWSKTWYSPVDTYEEAELGLRFTLSKPVTAAVSPGHIELLRWACDAADRFKPLSAEEEKMVAERAENAAPIFQHA